MAGRKPETFNKAENEALRRALRGFVERAGSQAKAAAELKIIGQQAIGHILNRGGGFSLPTANALAVALGYEDAKAIINAAGAAPNPMTVPQGWANRELAVSIARRLGYPEEVIRRVVVKFQEDSHRNRTARWWNDRIVIEAAEYAAVQGSEPPPPPASAARPPKARDSKPAPVRRRKVG